MSGVNDLVRKIVLQLLCKRRRRANDQTEIDHFVQPARETSTAASA